MSGNPIWFSCSAATALSTSYAAAEVTDTTGTDSRAKVLPTEAYLYRLEGTLTSIVTAAEVTWYIAKDAAGEKPITPEKTVTILDPDSDGSGGINTAIETAHAFDADSSGTSLYVHAKTDAGTASMVARITWEAR
jgi:hypothetical protein